MMINIIYLRVISQKGKIMDKQGNYTHNNTHIFVFKIKFHHTNDNLTI